MVYEKNGALKSTYYYFGWEQLNHFIPLCASFLHFDEVINIDSEALTRSKPEDYCEVHADALRGFKLRYDASPGVRRVLVPANDVAYF